MPAKRITIIPAIHGKLTFERKVCKPDIAWIIEKWLDRHPEIRERRKEIRVVTGRWTTEDGLETEVRSVSIVAGDDLAGYDPEQDAETAQIRQSGDASLEGRSAAPNPSWRQGSVGPTRPERTPAQAVSGGGFGNVSTRR